MTDRVNPPCERPLIRVAVYGLATTVDVVLAALMQASMLKAADLTGSGMVTGSLAATWAVVYMIASLAIGALTAPKRVAGLLVAACVLLGLTPLGLTGWSGLTALYLLSGISAVGSALFFVPFQLFMKLVDEGQNKGVAHSAGFYTFSWSLGYAIGPFVIGFLWSRGWNACMAFCTLTSAATGLGVVMLRHHARPGGVRGTDREAESPRAEPPANAAAANRLPDLAWMAWIFSGIGSMMVTLVRSQLPITAKRYEVSAEALGTVLFALSLSQGLTAFLLGWTKRWMYHGGPVFAFGACGAAALALFAGGRAMPALIVAGVLMGVYTGSAYFYLVYHSLVHPTRAPRYVSINEAVVGVGGAVGPAAGGVLADYAGGGAPYAASAGLVLVAVSTQALLHARLGTDRPRLASAEPPAG